MKRGFVQVYTGDGKGKTTCAFGLAARALGWGMSVFVFQFFKTPEDKSGELEYFKKTPGIKIMRKNIRHPFFDRKADIVRLKKELKKCISGIRDEINGGKYDVIILDEINNAVAGGYVDIKDVIELIENRPQETEIILTGRGATKQILRKADIVTVFKCKKHPFQKGIKARKGIEY